MHDAQSRSSQNCETTCHSGDVVEVVRARRYYMRMHLQRWLYVLCFVSIAPQFCLAEDWTMFGRTPSHASFNRVESTISGSVLSSLQPAWAQSFDTVIAASPTVVD